MIWRHASTDGADHGPSCAAFASLMLELGSHMAGLDSWVTGGGSYPWPVHSWVDGRVDPNPASPSVVSVLQDARTHGRWHPLGDGYTPQPGDWVLFDGHVEVVTKYAAGVLNTIGGDSLPNLSVNAHEYAGPLAGQGVAGFVDNGVGMSAGPGQDAGAGPRDGHAHRARAASGSQAAARPHRGAEPLRPHPVAERLRPHPVAEPLRPHPVARLPLGPGPVTRQPLGRGSGNTAAARPASGPPAAAGAAAGAGRKPRTAPGLEQLPAAGTARLPAPPPGPSPRQTPRLSSPSSRPAPFPRRGPSRGHGMRRSPAPFPRKALSPPRTTSTPRARCRRPGPSMPHTSSRNRGARTGGYPRSRLPVPAGRAETPSGRTILGALAGDRGCPGHRTAARSVQARPSRRGGHSRAVQGPAPSA